MEIQKIYARIKEIQIKYAETQSSLEEALTSIKPEDKIVQLDLEQTSEKLAQTRSNIMSDYLNHTSYHVDNVIDNADKKVLPKKMRKYFKPNKMQRLIHFLIVKRTNTSWKTEKVIEVLKVISIIATIIALAPVFAPSLEAVTDAGGYVGYYFLSIFPILIYSFYKGGILAELDELSGLKLLLKYYLDKKEEKLKDKKCELSKSDAFPKMQLEVVTKLDEEILKETKRKELVLKSMQEQNKIVTDEKLKAQNRDIVALIQKSQRLIETYQSLAQQLSNEGRYVPCLILDDAEKLAMKYTEKPEESTPKEETNTPIKSKTPINEDNIQFYLDVLRSNQVEEPKKSKQKTKKRWFKLNTSVY